MRVAGFGFRAGATVESLADALGEAAGLAAIATAEDKAGAAAIRDLATRLGLPVVTVPLAEVVAQAGAARVGHSPGRYGGRSLAEAAALAACGPGSRLAMPRRTSRDGLAVAAVAEGGGPAAPRTPRGYLRNAEGDGS